MTIPTDSDKSGAVAVTLEGKDWRKMVGVIVTAGLVNLGVLFGWVWHADRRITRLEIRDEVQALEIKGLADQVASVVKEEVRPIRDSINQLIGQRNKP